MTETQESSTEILAQRLAHNICMADLSKLVSATLSPEAPTWLMRTGLLSSCFILRCQIAQGQAKNNLGLQIIIADDDTGIQNFKCPFGRAIAMSYRSCKNCTGSLLRLPLNTCLFLLLCSEVSLQIMWESLS